MKIAISGAGIAGPTLAYWLERTGHEPTLIEQAPQLRTAGYIVDFWGVGYTVAERMGILPAVREAGYTVSEVRLVDANGRKAGGFSIDAFRRILEDRFTSVRRGDLAAAIHQALAGRVETVFDDSVTAIEEHGDGVHVGFRRSAARDFDLLIGADGLHSAVRALAFGPEERFEVPLGFQVAAFELAGYHPRDELVYVSHTQPGRQIARFSLRGDRTLVLLVFLTELAAGTEPQSLADCKALLHRVFDGSGWEAAAILEAMDGVEGIYFDRVSQIRMPTWSAGRVMLIGDAAACVSLLAGEGTGLAMTEAYVLAGELEFADGNHREAFGACEAGLRPFIEGKQKSAAAFASAFAPKTRLGLWLRNKASRLMAAPVFADLLMGRTLRDDFELPDYDM
jgi:2-polyprenyl-6-methoxyphenol hydroxylase-like FAD-dependent oxidoreductase